MTRLELEMDEFYIRQISFWLQQAQECDVEIRYWEAKRMALRHTHNEN
jgi:hypothetical protein